MCVFVSFNTLGWPHRTGWTPPCRGVFVSHPSSSIFSSLLLCSRPLSSPPCLPAWCLVPLLFLPSGITAALPLFSCRCGSILAASAADGGVWTVALDALEEVEVEEGPKDSVKDESISLSFPLSSLHATASAPGPDLASPSQGKGPTMIHRQGSSKTGLCLHELSTPDANMPGEQEKQTEPGAERQPTRTVSFK